MREMDSFEEKVLRELLCIEELRRIACEGYDWAVATSLEAVRRQAFLARILEERLHAPQRERFYRDFEKVAAEAAIPLEGPRGRMINTGKEFDL